MRRRLYIPPVVRDAIHEHVAHAAARSQDEYLSASEDEDAMTGHLGARLTVRARSVVVTQDETPGEWKWSISYAKFRGRGPGATEKALGADGIFELTLDRGYRKDTKSLLFQAKMADQGGTKLLEQCIKLSTWREAAVVLEYAPSGFSALAVDDVVEARGSVGKVGRRALAEVIGRAFVDCDIGDNDLSYDRASSRLRWRSMRGELVATVFRIKHKLRIKVRPPGHGVAPDVDRIVQPNDLHQFRMEASDEDILSVSASAGESELKRAHKRLASAYHPDRLGDGEQLLRELLNRRTQEVNDAWARLRKKDTK